MSPAAPDLPAYAKASAGRSANGNLVVIMGKNIVITGGAGFIGSHLVKKLVERGEKVIIVDNLSAGSRENLEYLGVGDVKIIEADLMNWQDAKEAIEDADTVYHMAARVGGIPYLHDAEDAELVSLETNITIDANVFRACREAGVRKIIYPSSVSVYPMERQKVLGAVFSEEDFIHPDNLNLTIDPDGGYGLAKVIGEIELNMMAGVQVGIARIFSAYGENEPQGDNAHVLPPLIRSAINYPKEQMIIWGTGEQTRDYLYVTDCAEALIKLSEITENSSPEAGPAVVNVGAGRAVSIKELAEKIIGISGKKIKPLYDAEKPVGPVSRTADISRAKEMFGWEPKVGLEEGLQRTYKWLETKARV